MTWSSCSTRVSRPEQRGGLRGGLGRGSRRQTAAATKDAATFALRGTAPDAVLDAMLERVFEALGAHGATRAHALGGFDAETVGRKELRGTHTPAARVEHPRVLLGCFLGGLVHGRLPSRLRSLKPRGSLNRGLG